jgi:hypothetical protein
MGKRATGARRVLDGARRCSAQVSLLVRDRTEGDVCGKTKHAAVHSLQRAAFRTYDGHCHCLPEAPSGARKTWRRYILLLLARADEARLDSRDGRPGAAHGPIACRRS